MIVKFFDFFGKNRPLCKACGYAFAGLILLWSLFFVHHEESHFALEALPGFWTLFTICCCIALVVFTLIYGKTGIKKGEDYYDS